MNSYHELQSRVFEDLDDDYLQAIYDIDEYDNIILKRKEILPDWNKTINDFLIKYDFKISTIKAFINYDNDKYIHYSSPSSDLFFCQLETVDDDEMNQNNYNWIIRYKDADWSLKLLGVKHKSYHHVNLFPVNANFFTKSGDSLGDALIDDSKKSLLKNYITDFNLQKDKNLLKEFSFMVIGFCQKWVDLYEQKEDKRLKELNVSQTNVLSELDKDGNGEVDVVEGNDFNLLLKKHQKSIVEVDRNYVQQFVKVSSYLKTKKGNIQSIFNSIKDTPNQEILNEYVEILKDEIHTYNLILFNSLNMIVSLVEDDMITFYEIHEMFDTLNMFDSKHEKDVSQKLTNIGDGLESLMYEIRDMGNKISNSIQELSYVTEESNRQLTNQLSEIDSTMKVGNLINTINTYQNYKNNKNTKSLRG